MRSCAGIFLFLSDITSARLTHDVKHAVNCVCLHFAFAASLTGFNIHLLTASKGASFVFQAEALCGAKINIGLYHL